MTRLRRSALYVPASNARALEKARGLDADIIIIDLEDAVAPEQKVAARVAAVRAVEDRAFGGRGVVIRCNGLATPWGAEDLAALRGAPPNAVLIPKVSEPADIALYAAALGPEVPIWAMIETCSAVLSIAEIATMSRTTPLAGLVLGTNDLLFEMRAREAPDRAPLQTAMAMTVTAARANGLIVLDGVHNEIADEAGLVAACNQGRDFGFDGKTLIHPGQIMACNRAFTPSDLEVTAAKAVIAAFASAENASSGAIAVGGRMVERLHLADAQRVIGLWQASSGVQAA